MPIKSFPLASKRRSQPESLRQVDWKNPLTNGLVFACYPTSTGFVDIISGQFVSNLSTMTNSTVQTVDGNSVTSLYRGSSSGGSASPLQFTNQTGLDLITGAYTLFVDAIEGAQTDGAYIFGSYSSSNGYGVRINYDDGGPTANDSFNIYTGNSTNTQYYTGGAPNHALVGGPITNNNSYKFAKRFAITSDASSNINWYANNALKQTAAWGANRLPQSATSRRTFLANNANHKIALILGFNRALSLAEYSLLYENPWQVIKSQQKTFRKIVPGASLTGVSSPSSAAGNITIGTVVGTTTGVSATGNVGGVGYYFQSGSNITTSVFGVRASSAVGSISAVSVAEVLGGVSATSGTGTLVQSFTNPAVGVAGSSDGNVVISFGPSSTYYDGTQDGVGSVSYSMPSASFTGSVSGTVLTVTAVASGTIAVDLTLIGQNVSPGTVIITGGGGTGGVGTYWLNNSQNISSQFFALGQVYTNVGSTLACSDGANYVQLQQQGFSLTTGASGGQSGFATPFYSALSNTFVGSVSGNTLTVTALSAGCGIFIGQALGSAGPFTIPSGVTVTSLGTGAGGSGGAALGTYTLSQSLIVPSTNLTLGGKVGTYYAPTNKGALGDAGVFSDAHNALGTPSSLITISQVNGLPFNMTSIDIAPGQAYSTNGSCYVSFTGYSGGTTSNNGATWTGGTQVAFGYIVNTTSGYQTFNLTNLGGTGLNNVTYVVMQDYGYTIGNQVGGASSNSPFFQFSYVAVQPVQPNLAFSTAPILTGATATGSLGQYGVPTESIWGVSGSSAAGNIAAIEVDAGTHLSPVNVSGSPSIYLTDWQGTNLETTTPRKNLLVLSESMGLSPWALNGVVVEANQTYGNPRDGAGGNTDSLTRNGSAPGNWADILQNVSVAAGYNVGQTYTGSIWLWTISGTCSVYLAISDANYNTYTSSVITVNTTPTRYSFTSSGGSGWNSAGTSIGFGLDIQLSTSNLLAFGAQLVNNTADGTTGADKYIRTGATPAAVTDYSITSSGLVTYAVAPRIAAVSSWTGSGNDLYTNAAVSGNNTPFGVGDGSTKVFQITSTLAGLTAGVATGMAGVAYPTSITSITGVSSTTGLGSATPTNPTNGVSTTGGIGTTKASLTTAITGVTTTSAVGTVVETETTFIPITGVYASGYAGNIVFAVGQPLAGVISSSGIGTVTQGGSNQGGGVSSVGQAGLVSGLSSVVALTGNSSHGQVGYLQIVGNAIILPITGNYATTSVGSVIASFSGPGYIPTFNFDPVENPVGTTTYRTLNAQFGDGYSQQAADGINSVYDVWTLTWQGGASDIQPVKTFLDTQMGYLPFYWTPPMGVQNLYLCDGALSGTNAAPTLTPAAGGNYTYTATFRMVYHP